MSTQSLKCAQLFYVRKDKTIDGTAPVYLRITMDGRRAEYALGMRVAIEKWSSGKAKGSSGDAQRLNQEIERIKYKVYEIRHRFELEERAYTAQMVVEALSGKQVSRHSLLDTITKHNDMVYTNLGKTYAKATYTRYETIRRHIEAFIPLHYKKEDLLLSELNYEFVESYATHLRTQRGCNNNSTMKYVKLLKTIIHYAMKHEWLAKDPFAAFKCPIEEVERVALTEEEIALIENKHIEIERLGVIRDIFVFSIYTGLAYIDVQQLTPDGIQTFGSDRFVAGKRGKTGKYYHSLLFGRAERLIERYSDHPKCVTKGVVFPVPSNQKVNAYLKELADLCGIKKPLTFHIARHTYATTITSGNNIAIESISHSLGHATLSMTQHYAKISPQKLSKEFQTIKKRYQ